MPIGRPKLDRTKTCPRCGEEFKPKDWRNTYCSRRCSKLKDLPTKECEACGETFRKNPEYSYAVWAKVRHCSNACAGNGRPIRYADCETCGTSFRILHGERPARYCTRECFAIAQRSDRFPVAGRRRGLTFSASQKRSLLSAARHKCVRCNGEQDLECDHIVAICNGGSHSLANGQVLCRDCHRTKTNAEIRALYACDN